MSSLIPEWPLRCLIVVAFASGVYGCVPLNPDQKSVVGMWTVESDCGVETLDLKADGTFAYEVRFPDGRRAVDAGRWRIDPPSDRLAAADLVLQNARQLCPSAGSPADPSNRYDRRLQPNWEWGRTMLIYDPDLPGFTRAKHVSP